MGVESVYYVCMKGPGRLILKPMLKLKDEKTEVILITSKHGLKSQPNITVTVGEQQLQSSSVRDIGVIYDQHLSMSRYVYSECQTGYNLLRNIGRIRGYHTL